ncbi:MAG: glycosyltransferase [Bacteroidota bacterium]
MDPFEIYDYWSAWGFGKLVRVFWYFILFEMTRYVLVDFFVLVIFKITARSRRARWEAAKQEFWNESPLISIIAPGKNEGKNIYKLVKSLNEQTYQNVEIIIVDDGSDDDSAIIGRSLERHGLIDVFIRNEKRGGKASAANLALRYCTGKYLLHLDADSSFDRDAVERIIIPFYMDERIGGVGGNVKVRNYKESLCARLQAIEYLKSISSGRIVTSYLGIYRIISGAFGSFRMDAIRQIGGWDIGPGLDGDITVKLRKAGYNIHFEHTAVCLTAAPTKFRKLWNQRMRWSRSLVRFRLRKHIDVFLPHKGFRLTTFLAFVENITYNFLLDLKWYVYIIDMVLNYGDWIKYIFPINILLYIVAGFAQQFTISQFSERAKEERVLWPYIPLMVFYVAGFLRLCRTFAYIRELFFKSSYRDPWNPQKSSYQAVKEGY